MKFTIGRAALFFIAFALFSCGSPQKIIYLQNIDNIDGTVQSFEPTLQPDDLLSIIVSAETPEVTLPFNIPMIQGNYQVGNNQSGIKTYLVDIDGNIDFPVLGKIKLGGLTHTAAKDKLVAAVSEYVKEPAVNLRILNYKVSVLGEVSRPGPVPIESQRITLLEAISAAGDLTIYGKRENILVIREAQGKKSYNRVDITKADFLNSPFYYLVQNDIVVVEPNRTRINSSVIGPNITVIFSGISLLITIGLIIFR